MHFISCQECGKKLLKIGNFDKLSIKCSRCKTINHLSVENAANFSNTEDHESQIQIKGNTRGHTQKDPKYRPQSAC